MAAVVLGLTADALEEYTPNSLASPLFNCFISICAFSMRLRKQFEYCLKKKERHSQLGVNVLHVAEFVAKATFSKPGGGLIGLSATVLV